MVGVLVVPGLFAQGIGWLAAKRLDRLKTIPERVGFAYSTRRLLARVSFGYYLLAIWVLQEHEIRNWFEDLNEATESFLPDMFLDFGALWPVARHLVSTLAIRSELLLWLVGGWAAVQGAGFWCDRILRKTSWSAFAYLQFWFAGLLPAMMLYMALGVVEIVCLGHPLIRHCAEAVSVLLVLMAAPFLIGRALKTRRIPSGALAVAFERLARRAGVRIRHLDIWPVRTGRVGTAMAIGVFPRSRSIVISDVLVNTLNSGEILAVLAHELSHLKRHHVARLIAILTGSIFVAIFTLVLVARWFDVELFRGNHWSPLQLSLLIVGVLFVRGALLRRYEYQADRDAAQLTGKPGALASALLKLAKLHASPVRWRGLDRLIMTHPDIQDRVAALRKLTVLNRGRSSKG